MPLHKDLLAIRLHSAMDVTAAFLLVVGISSSLADGNVYQYL